MRPGAADKQENNRQIPSRLEEGVSASLTLSLRTI